MGRLSQKFDQELFIRKLSEPSREMQIESLSSRKDARLAKFAGSVLIQIVHGQLTVLRKYLRTVDQICREVWQSQGEAVTHEFVREILIQQVMTAIAVRSAVTNSYIDSTAAQTHEDPYASRRHLAKEAKRLKSEVINRYEIEVRELGYRSASTKAFVQQKGSKTDQGLVVETKFLTKHEESALRGSAQQNGQENSSAHAEEQDPTLSPKLQRGKRCAQIIEEMKRFKYLRLDSGKTVTEIQTEWSNFLIWKMRENLSAEDRDVFDHPNQWESVVTYTYGLLGKEYAKSWTTIRDWVKAWKRSQQPNQENLGKRK